MSNIAISKPKSEPPIITIIGTPGVGKTSLGALFPSPIFIQAEKAGTVFESWDQDAAPDMFHALPRPDVARNISTLDAIKEQVVYLGKEDHGYKTLVIDSITSLHKMFETEVCQRYNVDNIADAAGGFHKGYLVVSEMHGKLKAWCERLREVKGMSVVFLAHCGIQRMKNNPDTDEYAVFTLDMHKESIHHYVNLVDAALYLRNEEFVKEVTKDKKGKVTRYGKIVQTGQRALITCGDGKVGYINAKNRYNLDPEINVNQGENPLIELISFYRGVNS